VKRDYLQQFKAEESREIHRYFSEISDSTDLEENSYLNKRIPSALAPIVIADTDTFLSDKQKIWSQIPFAGTLLVPLRPVKSERMLEVNAFETKDISTLIQLSKETRRIHFCVPADALLYEGLDHLDPIFQEAKPLMLWSWNPKDLVGKEELRKMRIEFDTVARIKYKQFIFKSFSSNTDNNSYFKYLMRVNLDTYTNLKILGLATSTNLILEKMIDDPAEGVRLLMAMALVIDPLFRLDRAHDNRSLKKLQQGRIIKNYDQVNREFQSLSSIWSSQSSPDSQSR
jgi:hypothetical protein